MNRARRAGAILLLAGIATGPSAGSAWPSAGPARPSAGSARVAAVAGSPSGASAARGADVHHEAGGGLVVHDESPKLSFIASVTHWLVAARLAGSAATGSSAVALTGVACPEAGRCVAVGGRHAAIEDGVAGWHLAPVPARTGYLTSVACPSPTSCLAVAESTATSKTALVIASGDGGRSWRVAYMSAGPHAGRAARTFHVSGVAGISCPTPTRCVAVGTGEDPARPQTPIAAAALLTVNGGRTWRTATLPPGLAGLNAVSCASASQSAATGWLENDDRPVTATSADGGAKWHLRSLPASVAGTDAVSCPTAAVCYVSGFEAAPPGATVYPGAVIVSRDGGRKWEVLRLPNDAGPVNAVTCVDADRCVAVGIDSVATAATSAGSRVTPPSGLPGIVIVTADSGRSFAVAKLPKGVRGLAGVACEPRRPGGAPAGWPMCVATAADGHLGSLILASLAG